MKKIITTIVSLVLCLTALCFSACSKEEKSGLRSNLSEKLMVDFESINEIKSVQLTAHEAQVFLNTDKKYVSSGNASMEMHLNKAMGAIGYYEDTVLQFIPGQQYFNQTDFSKVVGISADIWNVNDFNVEMCFSLNNKQYVIDYVTLKPGYNKAEFIFDNNQVISFTDKQLVSLDFSFYSDNGKETLYIDNVKLITTSEDFIPYDYTATYKNDIIFGYEDYAEALAIIDLGGYDSLFSRAHVSINADKRYITQGEGSLKVDFYKSPKDKLVDNTMIRTYDNIMADFNQYKGKDYALTCDVFNATDKSISMQLKIFSTTDDETYAVNVTIPARSWSDRTKLRMPISDIEATFKNEQIMVLTVVYAFSGVEAGDTVYIDNLHFEGGNV